MLIIIIVYFAEAAIHIIHALDKKHNNTGCNKRQDSKYICHVHAGNSLEFQCFGVKPDNNITECSLDDTPNTGMLARSLLRQRGWLGVCHTPVLYQNGYMHDAFNVIL